MELISSGLFNVAILPCFHSLTPHTHTHTHIYVYVYMYTYLYLPIYTLDPPPPPALCFGSWSPLSCLTSPYPPSSVSSPRPSVLVRLSLPFALQSRFISVHDSFCSISSKVSRFVHLLLSLFRSPSSHPPLLPKKAIVIHGGNPSEQIFSGHFMYKHAWLSITWGGKKNENVQKERKKSLCVTHWFDT